MPASTIFTAGQQPIDGIARANGKTAAFTVSVPAGASVRAIHIRNNTANAVTGGLKIGTTLAGVDVVAAGPVVASALITVLPLISANGIGVARTLYFDAVTGWNAANIDVSVEYTKLV